MRAFRLAAALGANGIETDIRRTKDGVPVLFHDADLLRLTGDDKKIAEPTFRELSAYRIPTPDGGCADAVPRLTELLDFAKKTGVLLALELKDDGLEADLTQAIRACGLRDACTVTSFRPERLAAVKALDAAQKVGLLTDTVNADVLGALKKLGAEQICPKAALLTPALVSALHAEGFNVRAWGVRDEATMAAAFLCGVDGMTVNFPDKLQALLHKNA